MDKIAKFPFKEMTVLNPGDEVKELIGKPVIYPTASQKKSIEIPGKELVVSPIVNLTPYQNKWTIKARVTAKTHIRPFRNGKGKIFSINLIDNSSEIRAIAFDEIVDKFYERIEVDKVYYISKALIKLANQKFSNLKNKYEMQFTRETIIQICEDDNKIDVPAIKYDFIPISQLANLEPKVIVDCIGVCKEVGELQFFISRKTNKECKKRELVLIDTSEKAVTLTLWGDDAVNFNGQEQQVILVKGATVHEFNSGKSLSFLNDSVMKINPDIAECHKLYEWLHNGGGENITISISARTDESNTEWRTFHETRNLEICDKDEYFKTKAVIHIIKSDNAYYKGCPQCNRKVVDENNGKYRCEKCNDEYPNFKYKLILNMNIGDWSSNKWVTCFNDLAEQLLGRSAHEIGETMDNNPTDAEEILGSINFRSYIFKLRSKVEIYQDTVRNKFIVQSASPINYKEYNKYLINNLKELTGINKV